MSALDLMRWHESELSGLLARVDRGAQPELHARMSARLDEATSGREHLEHPVVVNPFLSGVRR